LPEDKSWTLVTAYFDLTKMPDASAEIKARSLSYYADHARATLALDYNLVVYCEEDNLEKIQAMRPEHLRHKTKYITCSFEDFPMTQHRDKIIKNRQAHPYRFDNRNTASYYLFCVSRCAMLKQTIESNPFGSTHFAWINFCIERMGHKNLIYLDEGLQLFRDKFSTCYIDYIPYKSIQNLDWYFEWGRCTMCSGFYTGNAHYMFTVCDLFEKKFLEFLELGYGHADEQLFSPVYFENPDLFEFYLGDYAQMITNYKYVRDECWRPVHQALARCVEAQDWDTGYKLYLFYKNSLENGHAQTDPDTLKKFLGQSMSILVQTKQFQEIPQIVALCGSRGVSYP